MIVKLFQLQLNYIALQSYTTDCSFVIFIILLVFNLMFFVLYHKWYIVKRKNIFLNKEIKNNINENIPIKTNILEEEKEILSKKIKEKTIELAIKAKEDDEKNRILHVVLENIIEVEDNPNKLKIKLGEARRIIKNYIEKEDHTFALQMDEIHQDFFKLLKARYANLSIYDLRLCAYLKLGLNSKEMSDILGVLPSSINVSRSRLRKKLGLKPEEDLYDFLINLQ